MDSATLLRAHGRATSFGEAQARRRHVRAEGRPARRVMLPGPDGRELAGALPSDRSSWGPNEEAGTVRILRAIWALIIALLRRPIRAPEPAPPVAHDIPQSRRFAVHEAGHAVAAWYCTAVERITRASIDANGGVVVMRSRRGAPWCDAVILLAGIAAEGIVIGRFSSGPAREDLRHAIAAIRDLPDREDRAATGPTPDLERAFASPLSERERRLLRAAYGEAREIIRAHRDRFDRLADELHRNGSLDESEMRLILGARGPIAALGHFSFSFWKPGATRSESDAA